MEIKPEDRNTRDSLIREIDSLQEEALSANGHPEIKAQYREAKRALETLVGKLRDEGVKI